MTREEAIAILEDNKPSIIFEDEKLQKETADLCVALNMAIHALGQNERAEEWYKLFVEKLDEQEPCEKSMNKAYEFGNHKGVGVYWNMETNTVELPKAVFEYILRQVPTDEQEPCEDAISREAVKNEFKCWIGSGEYRKPNASDYLGERLRELPSVQPSRKDNIECEWAKMTYDTDNKENKIMFEFSDGTKKRVTYTEEIKRTTVGE